MQAPRGEKLKVYGNIVNIPAYVNSTVSMLSRLPHESGAVNVNLKRKLQHKCSSLSLNLNPQKVV